MMGARCAAPWYAQTWQALCHRAAVLPACSDNIAPRLVVRNSREVMGFSKLRRRDFDLCRLRRLLSDAYCRAVRSTTGRYDRHSSSSAFGMEAAADSGMCVTMGMRSR